MLDQFCNKYSWIVFVPMMLCLLIHLLWKCRCAMSDSIRFPIDLVLFILFSIFQACFIGAAAILTVDTSVIFYVMLQIVWVTAVMSVLMSQNIVDLTESAVSAVIVVVIICCTLVSVGLSVGNHMKFRNEYNIGSIIAIPVLIYLLIMTREAACNGKILMCD